jgi:hypothetical protein
MIYVFPRGENWWFQRVRAAEGGDGGTKGPNRSAYVTLGMALLPVAKENWWFQRVRAAEGGDGGTKGPNRSAYVTLGMALLPVAAWQLITCFCNHI